MQLTQGQLVVISVVEHIQQIPKEGMHVIHLGEVFQDLCELVMPAALRELDLQGIQAAVLSARKISKMKE